MKTAMKPRLNDADTFSALRSVSRWVSCWSEPWIPKKYMR